MSVCERDTQTEGKKERERERERETDRERRRKRKNQTWMARRKRDFFLVLCNTIVEQAPLNGECSSEKVRLFG